jgi:hypothetical protein
MGPEQKLPSNQRIDSIIRDGCNRTIRLPQIPLTTRLRPSGLRRGRPATTHRPPSSVLRPLPPDSCPLPPDFWLCLLTTELTNIRLAKFTGINHREIKGPSRPDIQFASSQNREKSCLVKFTSHHSGAGCHGASLRKGEGRIGLTRISLILANGAGTRIGSQPTDRFHHSRWM